MGKRKKIFIFVVIAMFLVSICVLLFQNRNKENIISERTESSPDDHIDTENLEKKSTESVEEVENYQVQVENLSFEVLEAEVIEENPFENMRNIEEFNSDFGQGEHLSDGYSYLRVNLEITNLSDEGKEMGLNNHHLLVHSGKEELEKQDLYMIDINQDKINNSQYFHYYLDAKSAETVQLLYIIKNEYLVDPYNIFLQIDPMGQSEIMVFGRDKDGNPVEMTPTENVKNVLITPLINS